MGLPFLNKKSWHTGSFKNIEQVWIAEEKYRAEQKRQEELRKKLKEEKYNEQLKRMQVEAGLLPKSELDKISWMYDVHTMPENQTNNAENYLLGKPVDKLGDEASLNQLKNHERRFDTTIEEEDEAKDGDINEDFARLQEDPLFQIRKEELKRKNQILNNPVRLKLMMEELEKREKEFRKKKKKKKDKKKKSKKDNKKKKKAKKGKKTKEESDEEDADSDDNDNRDRSKSRSKASRKSSRSSKKVSIAAESSDESSDEDSRGKKTRATSRSSKKGRASRSRSQDRDRKKKHKKRKSSSKSRRSSKSSKRSKKSHKTRSTSAASNSSSSSSPSPRSKKSSKREIEDDRMFNNFVKRTLGPLVEFDEDSYRLRFTAKHRFKNNDRRRMTKEEQDSLREAMRRNADMYEKKKLDVHLLEYQEDGDVKNNPQFLKDYHREAFLKDGDVNSLATNVKRARYFQDSQVVTRDDNEV